MKKLNLTVKALTLTLLVGAATACGSGSNAPAAGTETTPKQEAESATPTLNIRYVDHDSIMANYNLAKDFQDAYVRGMAKIENARQAKGNELGRLAQSIEQKARSNGYLSEASFNADQATLQKKQQEAEAYLANLSRNTEQELNLLQMQLNDSIEKFIKEYNSTKGYDAILLKAAGLYFSPSLDITKEVVDGLNARYTKVEQK